MKGDSGSFGNSPTSNGLYSIPKINTKNLGKVGYVSDNGEVREYPQNMVSYSNAYYSMGNYTNEGNDIDMIKNISAQECKDKCNSNSKCAGYVFDTTGGVISA